jgi:hypothetical protein
MPRKTDGEEILLGALLGANTGDCIERQERDGQRQLAQDDELPTDGIDDPALAAWGVVKGEVKQGDPMFCHVTLPTGWSKVPTDHPMHTNLVDQGGRRRAAIFYKAAFYDRSASIRPCSRFSAGPYKDDWADRDAQYFPAIFDGSKIAWRGAFIPHGKERWGDSDKARDIAERLLKSKFPDYQDVLKYWDAKVDFGKSLSEPIKGARYELHVAIYRFSPGDIREKCAEKTPYASGICQDDQAAREKFEAIANEFLYPGASGASSIAFSIFQGEREV